MKEAELLPSEIPLFAALPHNEFRHLAATLHPIDVKAGAILFREGDCGDHFYIVAAGQVEVFKALGTGEEHLLNISGPGDFIGEMSLVSDEGRRTATVRAASHARLLEMSRADFERLVREQPRLAYELVRVLSGRLAASQDAALHDLQAKNRQLQQAYEALQAAQAQIIEKEKMERELQVAHNIQLGLLPRQRPDLPGFDLGALIEPMRAIGGDFYDFIPLDGHRLGIAIGDVSGHGVPAALFMALTVTLLRAEACRDCSPSDVLLNVNRQLLNLNSAGLFVTLLYGVLDYATGDFTYVRAGHEPPLIRAGDGNLSVPPFERSQLLGFFDDPALAEQTVSLPSGSTLLLYTDGVTEEPNAEAELFGHARLEAALRLPQPASAQGVCEMVLAQVTAHSSCVAPSDDITLVCLRAR